MPASKQSARRRQKLILFGAGSTGRGQVAQLAFEDGWELVLVDTKKDLVDCLRKAGRYTVRLFRPDGGFRDVVIDRYQVYHTGETEAVLRAVAGADLVVTSVIATNLPDVAPLLAQGLQLRARLRPESPLNVIAAENMERGSTVLRDLVMRYLGRAERDYLRRRIGFPDSMIARVVPIAEDPCFLVGEEYSEWTADKTAVIGNPPVLNGLEFVVNQDARLQRKLFIHNTGHACCAYWALAVGYRYVHEGARDSRIMAEVQGAIAESGAAISAEHGFTAEDIVAYRQNLLERLPGEAFLDSLSRVCREPLRKLGEHERFVGPLNLCVKHGLPYDHLARGLAVVMTTDLAGDEQYRVMKEMLAAGGPERVLSEVCHLGPTHPAHAAVLRHLASITQEMAVSRG